MTMTLKELRDRLASWYGGSEACLDVKACAALGEMADAIDAHLAGMGEPVAWGNLRNGRLTGLGMERDDDSGLSVPLFTAPPVDIAAVREVIASIDLRAETMLDPQCKGWANKLTAALPKETP